MDFSSLAIEHIIGVGLILALLAWNALTEKSGKAAIRDPARPDARLRIYNQALISLWLLATACAALWLRSGATLPELGLRPGAGWRTLLSWAVVGAIGTYMVASLVEARFSRMARIKLREQLRRSGDYSLIHPETQREHGRFIWLAITAGITEEVLFRGFLIGVLALIMPLWLAAILAAAIFILGHAYQGPQGMVGLLPITAILTLVYVVGDSLWPAIALHIIVDVAAGLLFRISDHFASADAEAGIEAASETRCTGPDAVA
ncbi:CPBP family intramembrane glutamic endopeptidase [Maricaulis sp.]|uniref:CPBP family intramembrane glutamic endopeptidase n=1 Tax=Maricaulis sp. TaxID=1486257 RepID=UPI003A921D58